MKAKLPANLALAVISSLLALLGGEFAVRVVDGYSVTRLALARVRTPVLQSDAFERSRSSAAGHLRRLPIVPGVNRDWFSQDPPQLAGRATVLPEFETVYEEARRHGPPSFDIFKAWNRYFFQQEICGDGDLFARFPGFAWLYEPSEAIPHPRYRYFPSATTPLGLVTNRFGWRGPDVDLDKPARTVRIAFLGASTTVSAHGYEFSYPDYVGRWLTIWSEQAGLGVRFEVLNLGREGISSTDIAAIVRQELLPVEPDIAVYYEGSNQFTMPGLEGGPPLDEAERLRLAAAEPEPVGHSALLARVHRAWRSPGPSLVEPPKPPYLLAWPEAVNERDPDVENPHLPLSLPTILADLDGIRQSLAEVGGELFLSSFVWLAEEGMRLDPVRQRYIFEYLNLGRWPYSYSQIRRMAEFQNRVYREFAQARGLEYLAVAERFPQDPDLFMDAVHMWPGGLRLRAWLTFQELVPRLEARLRDGRLPRADRVPQTEHPAALAPFRVPLTCSDEMPGRPTSGSLATRRPGRRSRADP